ncbi:MAG: DUF5684 domain-containing protein [Chitinophagales bacterium]|nr:DUF5684 domain-containing protein [Chitinophagales bacterium]
MKGMNLEDIDQQEELMTYLKHVDWNTPYGWSLALVFAAVLLLFFASLYKLFKLKGVPGWTALIPFLNYSVMAQIGGLPAISILLLFVPYINFVFAMVLIFRFFRAYNKGFLFSAVGSLFFIIFLPILAFHSNLESVDNTNNSDNAKQL